MNGEATVPTAKPEKPTRVRYGVLIYACALSIISYLHRYSIAGVASAISEEMKFTKLQMGYVFSGFIVGYGGMQIPTGLVGDRMGPRRALTWMVIFWSALTVLTGRAWNHLSLLIIRLLFGMAQAGAFPVTARSFTNWFPSQEAATAQGWVWTTARLGGAIGPGLLAIMMASMGWRTPFLIFGVLGLFWAILFHSWYRNTPQEHRGVNEAEKKWIGAERTPAPARNEKESEPVQVPWGRLLRSGNLWTISLMYFCLSFGWYFYVTWLPTYLELRGMSRIEAGVYSGLPLFLGAFGCILGGRLSDLVVRRTGNTRNRRFVGFGGFAAGALCLLASAYTPDAKTTVLCMAMAAFFGDLTLSSCWAICIEIGRKMAGTVSGFMNTWGNLGAFFSPVFSAYIVQRFGGWQMVIISYGIVLFLGALLWLRIDPTKSLRREPDVTPG